MIPAGFIIYASDDSEASITEAREHAKKQGLTPEDCRMIRRDGQILLELRKPWGK